MVATWRKACSMWSRHVCTVMASRGRRSGKIERASERACDCTTICHATLCSTGQALGGVKRVLVETSRSSRSLLLLLLLFLSLRLRCGSQHKRSKVHCTRKDNLQLQPATYSPRPATCSMLHRTVLSLVPNFAYNRSPSLFALSLHPLCLA